MYLSEQLPDFSLIPSEIDSARELGLPSDSEVIRRWSGSHWEIVLDQVVLLINYGESVERCGALGFLLRLKISPHISY